MPGTKKKKKEKKPTQEELDDERLREIEAKMKELVRLMGDRANRPQADEKLEIARETRDKHAGNPRENAFHKGGEGGGSKPIAVSMDTKSALDLAEALKMRIKLGEYALDLQDSLNRLAVEQVEILERCLKRARY